MRSPHLSELREPPVVGRFYMVPTVHYEWRGRVQDWPVLGSLHHDREHIGFPSLHYHFDGRFLTEAQINYVVDRGGEEFHWPGYALNANIVSEPAEDRAWTQTRGRIPRKPSLRRMMCKRAVQPWTCADASKKWGLDQVYGAPADAIRLRDGRLLCPHRKVDLSQFPPDPDGTVTCPLHGLRVRCVQHWAAAA